MKTLEMPTFDLRAIMRQLPKDDSFVKLPIPRELEEELSMEKRLLKAETAYRQFLALCKAYPEVNIMPTHEADVVWHRHLLNSEQYMKDCDAYFGYYLHHKPTEVSEQTYHRSVKLFAEHFGVVVSEISASEKNAPYDMPQTPSGGGKKRRILSTVDMHIHAHPQGDAFFTQ